jgi:hypothetical protein
MAEAARVPGKGWYVFAGAVGLAGVAAAAALAVWFALGFDRSTQFVVPGRLAAVLDRPGDYLVWNDYQTVFQGRSYNESLRLPSGVRIRVLDPAGGRTLDVQASQGATYSSGSENSVSVARFAVAQPGRYEIVVEGDFPPRVFSVGRDFFFSMMATIFGALALAFAGLAAAAGIAIWAYIRREAGPGPAQAADARNGRA